MTVFRVAALAPLVFALLSTPQVVSAATFTAATCSAAAVQAVIDASVSGDTVIVPNGTCRWATGVSNGGKAIHVQGQTPGGVVIFHDAPGHLFTLKESTAGPVRLSQLEFRAGTGMPHTIVLQRSPGGRAMLIHELVWNGPVNAIRAETNRGVIYKNAIDTSGADRSFVQCKVEGLGLPGWEAPHTMGTADTSGESNLYVEDNTITSVPLQAFDPDGNCRVVVRHNVFRDSGMSSHGPDTGPYGNRHTEIYNNSFAFTDNGCAQPPAVLDYFIFVRGGVWIIADNVIPDLKSCYVGDKAQLKFQVQNLRRNAGPMPCWAAGYPMPRQIGRGHDGAAYVSDPVYIWGNTGGGPVQPSVEDYAPDQCGGGASVTSFVQAGRDYIIGTPRPGYTKYPHPHPLRGNPPSPPTALRIVP